MRERFIAVEGTAATETDKAVCLELVVFDLDGVEQQHNQMWIPKANLHDDSVDTVDEAFKGDRVELYVSDWWLKQQ